MVDNFGDNPPDRTDSLDEMESALRGGSGEPSLIQAYHDQAVAMNQIDRARDVFASLLEKLSHDRLLQSLSIALCLRAGDDQSAMAGIEKLAAFCKPDDGLIDAALSVREKIGPETVRQGNQDRETISLCMIVKDEVAGIGACLNAAKSVVDEIIVVDTGSRDRTVDVARIYGARTYSFDWCDDFAAARNYSLSEARGKWILILDADEIIAAEDYPALRKMLEEHRQQPPAFSIKTRNYTNASNALGWQANDASYKRYETGMGWIGSRKIRLFPRDPRIRFQFPVHEKVDPSVKAAGIPVVDCPIPVHHYGDLNELKKRKKAEAYFKLGYAKLNKLGNDPAALRELAVQAGQLEHWTEAIELWRQLLEIRPNYAEAYLNMASAHWQLAQYEKSLQFAQTALQMEPLMKGARYNAAISLLFLGRAAEAETLLQETVIENPGYLAAHFMLAAARGCLGDVKRSQAAFQSLQNTPIAQAIPGAIEDLVVRLQNSGFNEYASGIKTVAAKLNSSDPDRVSQRVHK